MESEHAEVDQNTNNSKRDNASSDANPLVFQTPNSNKNDLTQCLNLRHPDQLETHFGDPGTEVRIPVNSEEPGHTQGARPKDLPDKLQRPSNSSVKNSLAKGML